MVPDDLISGLRDQAARHGDNSSSVYPALTSNDACEKFWQKYVEQLTATKDVDIVDICLRFAHCCQRAWLDYHRRSAACDDTRDWKQITDEFENALRALDEAGTGFEKNIEIFGTRNQSGHALRTQLVRASEAAQDVYLHQESIKRGARTKARRFAAALARECKPNKGTSKNSPAIVRS